MAARHSRPARNLRCLILIDCCRPSLSLTVSRVHRTRLHMLRQYEYARSDLVASALVAYCRLLLDVLDLPAAPLPSTAPINPEYELVIVTRRRSLFSCMSRKPPRWDAWDLTGLETPGTVVAATSPRRPFGTRRPKTALIVNIRAHTTAKSSSDQPPQQIQRSRGPPRTRHPRKQDTTPATTWFPFAIVSTSGVAHGCHQPFHPSLVVALSASTWRSPLRGWRCMTPSLGSWQMGALSKHPGTSRKWTPVKTREKLHSIHLTMQCDSVPVSAPNQ
jgi:hypothetical protein